MKQTATIVLDKGGEIRLENVHRAEVKRGRVVRIRLCGLAKLLGHLSLGVTEDHACLTFALRLRLHRHGVLESDGDEHIPHLDGNYTVFGRVVSGMEHVDRIRQGDRMKSVTIHEE